MKTFITAIVAAIVSSSVAVSPALAGQATDELSTCLADNTTGKDRKEMAQWIFAAMTAHPEIKTLTCPGI